MRRRQRGVVAVPTLWRRLCGVVLASALALGGCARDPYVTGENDRVSGVWRVSGTMDRVTGRMLPLAAVQTFASNSLVDDVKPAGMTLTCFDGRPLVRFGFGFKLGSDANTFLGYRFDDKPGRDSIAGVRFLQEYSAVVIEDPLDVATFVDDLTGSRLLYLRIRSITNGRTTAEFKLDGSAPALTRAFADCPLNAQTPVLAEAPRRAS